jgi:hypothetical protein
VGSSDDSGLGTWLGTADSFSGADVGSVLATGLGISVGANEAAAVGVLVEASEGASDAVADGDGETIELGA